MHLQKHICVVIKYDPSNFPAKSNSELTSRFKGANVKKFHDLIKIRGSYIRM